MSFKNFKIGTKIIINNCLLLVMLAILGVVSYYVINSLLQSNRWVDHTHIVIGSASEIEASAVDMETGMRGYLLAGKKGFLAPYEAGKTRFSNLVKSLKRTVDDNPAQVELLGEIETTINEWDSNIVNPMIDLREKIGDSKTMNDIAKLVAEERGKVYFDKFRGQINQFIETEKRLLAKRKSDLGSANSTKVSRWVEHTYTVIMSAQDILEAAINMETGMRGYLLAGKEGFLRPYNTGKNTFEQTVASLSKTVDDNPAQVRLLKEIKTNINQWQGEVVEPMISLRRKIGAAETMDDMAHLVGEAKGKVYFDKFRNQIKTFIDREQNLMEIRQKDAASTASSSKLLIIVSMVVAIVIGVLIAFYIIRIITIPLRKAVQFAGLIAAGDFSQQIDVDQKDEVGLMAEALARMGTVLKDAIASISDSMNRVSQGDFTKNIGDAGMTGELIIIKDSINGSIDMLSNTISQVVAATDQVNSGAGQISSASQALASGTSEQAASLEEISSSMSEVGSQAKANNGNANQAAQLTTQAMEVANRGNEQMKEMLASMDNINSSSKDISKIIKVIDEIAFQTNLLALNAAVEAARAGKYGKGFAVVAEEVRNLAARSAEAAKNTTELIENSVKEVDSGVSNASKTAEILNEIDDSVTKVNDLVGEIASASQEQSNSADEINKSLTQVNDVVQQNSSISEEAASASEELSGQAMELQALMGRFKLNQIAATTQQPTPIQNEIPAKKTVESPKMITLDDDNFGKY